jgi:hypothetical protein
VTGATLGNYTNITGAVTSTNGGTGNTATAGLVVSAPVVVTNIPVPTLQQWALVALGLLLAAFGFYRMRRR